MRLLMRDGSDYPRVMFTGGGTLGHIIPGLCVLEEILTRWPRAKCLFVASQNGTDAAFLRERGVPVWTLSPPQWSRRAWARPAFYASGTSNLLKAMGMLRRFRPHVVVGLGGFASVPIALGAALSGLPTVLLEQNARPGKANRLLSRWATRVCTSWPGTERAMANPQRVRVTGNPIRRQITTSRPGAAEHFGLDPGRRTLLVIGGSRGAVSVNDALVDALPWLMPRRDEIQVLHATGGLSYDKVRRAYWRHGIMACVQPFIRDMGSAYGLADLVLCRAGGSTLAELCVLGKPAILVPYPYAAEKHQDANAAVLVEQGAAMTLDQKELDPRTLGRMITELMGNTNQLREMTGRSLALGRPCAAAAVVDEIGGQISGRDGHARGVERKLTTGEGAWAWV